MSCAGASFYRPHWAAPESVGALMSLRTGGVSTPPWDTNNLGMHCGDAPAHVRANRARLSRVAGLPAEPRFLQQVHGADVLEQYPARGGALPPVPADGHFTGARKLPLAILTADCLPVLMCDESGQFVAAAHAGWRGVYAGVLSRLVRELRAQLPHGRRILVWVGPGIGPCCFEVGPEVRDAFVGLRIGAEKCFVPMPTMIASGLPQPRYKAHLSAIVRLQLAEFGAQITVDEACTFCDRSRFYSYRRATPTGRMAAMIWRK